MIYKLSDQAIGAMMGVLQKALLEQTDIVPLLRDFDVQVDDSNHLVITNPVQKDYRRHRRAQREI